jgi:hypothetical protein
VCVCVCGSKTRDKDNSPEKAALSNATEILWKCLRSKIKRKRRFR